MITRILSGKLCIHRRSRDGFADTQSLDAETSLSVTCHLFASMAEKFPHSLAGAREHLRTAALGVLWALWPERQHGLHYSPRHRGLLSPL